MAGASAKYPGEDAPLPRRRGGPPVSPEEAVGTARRMARERARRTGKEPELIDALPFAEERGTTPIFGIRAPRRYVLLGHAKADIEGRDLSDAMREALVAYGATPPGSSLVYVSPGSKAVIVPEEES